MGIGIPQLLTPPVSTIFNSGVTLVQGLVWDFLSTDVKWGIYYANTTQQVILGNASTFSVNNINAVLNGQLLSNKVYIDSVVALNQKKGSDLSNYRLETGGFATYNKVEKPRQIHIKLTKGGSEEDRGYFLRWLETHSKFIPASVMVAGNNLFDIYVPEAHYQNMTLIDYTIMRESRSGASLIIADCVFQEVMQVTMQYSVSGTSNAQNPSDLSTQNNSVQANSPAPNALTKLTGLFGA